MYRKFNNNKDDSDRNNNSNNNNNSNGNRVNSDYINPKKRLFSQQDLLNGLDSNQRDIQKKQFGSFSSSGSNSSLISNSFFDDDDEDYFMKPKYSLSFSQQPQPKQNKSQPKNNSFISASSPFDLPSTDSSLIYGSSSNNTIITSSPAPTTSLPLSTSKHISFQKRDTPLNGTKANNSNTASFITPQPKQSKPFDPFADDDEDDKPINSNNNNNNNNNQTNSNIVVEDFDFDIDENDFAAPDDTTITTTTTTTAVSTIIVNNVNNVNSNNNVNNNNSITRKSKNLELNQSLDNFIQSYKTNSSTTNGDSQSFFNGIGGKNNNSHNNGTDIPTIKEEEINEKIKHKPFRKVADSLKDTITHLHCSDHQDANLLDIPSDIPTVLSNVLRTMGYNKLYSHQLECRSKVLAGDDVIITTPTSSGKTLCLFLPLFEEILKVRLKNQQIQSSPLKQPLNKRSPCAMFLVPLNALANDQMASIDKLNSYLPHSLRLKIHSFSGDTNRDQMNKLFQKVETRPDIILTSPDWLHYQLYRGGIKSTNDDGWRLWFQNLRFVVLDEIHTYSGALGCHFINLIRRIQNYHYNLNSNNSGQSPNNNNNNSTTPPRLQFLMASATVGNPIEIGLKTISRQNEQPTRLHLIDKNGSGSFGKIFITLKSTKNPMYLPSIIINNWIQLGIKGIVFFNTIKSLNTLYESFTNDGKFSAKAKSVRPYYASLAAQFKKETLEQLKNGSVNVILSTNALEAGVNISELDACLIIGYPGSKMSWKQRVGRVGRSKLGLVIYIPDYYSPLDKFYSTNPLSLYESEAERLSFNGDFPNILSSHLLCASSEIGIESNYNYLLNLFGPNSEGILKQLLSDNKIKHEQQSSTLIKNNSNNNNGIWKSTEYHHLSVSLRGGAGSNDMVHVKLNNFNGREIEKVSRTQSLTRLFPGSIFMTHNFEGGSIVNYEVLDISLSKQKKTGEAGGNNFAIVKSIQFPKNVRTVTNANKVTTVEMKQILKQASFNFKANNQIQLLVSFGVGIYTTMVSSFEKKTIYSTFDQSNNKSDIEVIQLKQPLEVNFEAPCIEFSFTNSSSNNSNAVRDLLKPILVKKVDQLRNKLQSSILIDRKEYDTKIYDLLEMGETKVSLHTMIHEILSTVPLVLSPKNDIEETLNLSLSPSLSSSTNNPNSMFLVDSVEGGTGSCEEIFDHLTAIIAKSSELKKCTSCEENCEKGIHLSDELGCICCLHQNHCKNKGLLKSLGLINI